MNPTNNAHKDSIVKLTKRVLKIRVSIKKKAPECCPVYSVYVFVLLLGSH